MQQPVKKFIPAPGVKIESSDHETVITVRTTNIHSDNFRKLTKFFLKEGDKLCLSAAELHSMCETLSLVNNLLYSNPQILKRS